MKLYSRDNRTTDLIATVNLIPQLGISSTINIFTGLSHEIAAGRTDSIATVNLIRHLASLAQQTSSQDCLMRLHSKENRFNCYRGLDPTLNLQHNTNLHRTVSRECIKGKSDFNCYCELDPTLGISSTTDIFTGLSHEIA
jgi:hypothetical protein